MKKILSLVGTGMLATSSVAPLVANTTYEPKTEEVISSEDKVETTKDLISVQEDIIQKNNLNNLVATKKRNKGQIPFDLNINIHKVFNGTHTEDSDRIPETQLFKYTDYATSWDDFKTKYNVIDMFNLKIKLNAWNESKELNWYIINNNRLNSDSFYGIYLNISGSSLFAVQELIVRLKFKINKETETVNWFWEWEAYSFAAATSMTLDFEVNNIYFRWRDIWGDIF
ncbi:hypothetical protein C6B38_09310 [Spiroplasma sp. ChiS]|uniref:hypothetical protein n=1 Tax=Spiroplasma sp. ChiS TaxID=2099885 RepID=UPI000CF8B7E7|nr:hypothetical protein [Spiroplasma sp. ChiS]PQP77928.1 hypothetical protein C6B38_09310 [Spiroplasma sp. ChiS]